MDSNDKINNNKNEAKGKNNKENLSCPVCHAPRNKEDRFCRNCGFEFSKLEEKKNDKHEKIDPDAHKFNTSRLSEEEKKEINRLDGLDFDYRTDYEDLYEEKANFKSDTYLGSIVETIFTKNEYKDLDKADIKFKQKKESEEKDEAKSEEKSDGQEKKLDHKKAKAQKNDEPGKAPTKGEKKAKDKEERLDYTSKLPLITQADIEENKRKILSDEKRKLYKESKQRAANNENFVLSSDEEDLDQTQKIDLAKIKEIETEMRRVRQKEEDKAKENKAKEDRLKAAKEKMPKKNPAKAKKAKKSKKSKRENAPGPIKEIANARKYLVGVPLTIALVFFLIFGYFNSNKTHFLNNFEKALASDNLAEISKMTSKSEGESLDQLEAKALADLVNEDTIFRSALIGALKEDANELGKDSSYKSNRIYRLEKSGRKFIFFSDYKVYLDEISLDIKGAEGHEYKIGENDFVDGQDDIKLSPGIYPFIIKDMDFEGNIKVSNTVKSYQNRSIKVDMDDLKALNETSELAKEEKDTGEETESTEKTDIKGDAQLKLVGEESDRVYINGKDTGYSLKEFNELDGVNIKEADKISLARDFPWGKGFSEEYSYNGEESLELYLGPDNKETRELLVQTVTDMLKEDEKARMAMSTEGYTTIIEPELSETKEIIDSEVQNNTIYYRDYLSFGLDPTSVEVTENEDGTYSAYIGGVLDYKLAEVAPENLSEVDPYSSSEVRGFHMTYLPGEKWYVNLWGYTERYVNTENLIDIEIN